MPIPEYVTWLRSHVGTAHLWLPGMCAVILREHPAGEPDAPDRPGAAGADVLLVRRSDTGEYTPVTGIVDPGEAPHVTAVREAAEEACVEIEVERLVAVGVVGPITYPNGDVSSYLEHVYRCRWVAGEPAVGDDESTEAGWWPADALPDMPERHRAMIDLALTHPEGPPVLL